MQASLGRRDVIFLGRGTLSTWKKTKYKEDFYFCASLEIAICVMLMSKVRYYHFDAKFPCTS